ncbi:MAG: hypothetical protein IJT94_17335 [Oscillibacter sp.]|nr:hypothetical protein [Oscillibacter sp.]
MSGPNRYPFNPALLDAMPENLAELYRDLEARLLKEICSRLNAAGELNEVTVQDIRALRSHGIPLDQIAGAIQQTTGIGEGKLPALLDDVVSRNQRYYTELADLARVTMPDHLVDLADVYAVYEQTRAEYRNITRSLGFLTDNGRRILSPGNAYQWALDKAELQVLSGTGSYNQAIRGAVLELADSGLKTVNFESGHVDQADVAVRRAVMTGVNQLCQKYADRSMDYLETDLVEVSAHSGARDVDGPKGWENHKVWQGKVYRWNQPGHPRTEGAYPDFVAVCGYGDVQGIEGANRRHHYSPFIEGVMERTYTDEQLASIDPPPITYEGRTYTSVFPIQM